MSEKNYNFKRILKEESSEIILEAHNGISAKIVEEAGFKAIWASSLGISASLGVRDNNELSWTQVLEIVEFMNDVTSIPIMLDADSGYGNSNNVRRLVLKLEQRGISALCIEDTVFPNINSLLQNRHQQLTTIDEFTGKIKAAKDTQKDSNFCVIARIQAFISNFGLSEALKRADAYYKAGADAIFIHSRHSTAEEVLAFMKEWGNTCPVIIAPTTYYRTPFHIFEEAGFSYIIWSNHILRASIIAMQSVAQKIYKQKSVSSVEEQLVSIEEVFRLQEACLNK